jgi:uncharacterized protein with HEPN domain
MSYREYLQHILDETDFVLQKTNQMAKETFFKDEVLKRACVRSLEIIGEATKKLPDDFKENHRQIEWRSIAGTRDKLIHDYFGIDYDIVWDIVSNEIP